MPACDDVPGEAWSRTMFLFFDPIPEYVSGLALTVVLIPLGFGGRPCFLVGIVEVSAGKSS